MSLSLAAIGIGMTFLSNVMPLVRYFSYASYWTYIMHIPIVVCLQVWLLDVTLHWSMKFTFIMMATKALSLLVYDLWIDPGKLRCF